MAARAAAARAEAARAAAKAAAAQMAEVTVVEVKEGAAREGGVQEEAARAGVWGVPVVGAVHRIKWSCTSDYCCSYTRHNLSPSCCTFPDRSSSI